SLVHNQLNNLLKLNTSIYNAIEQQRVPTSSLYTSSLPTNILEDITVKLCVVEPHASSELYSTSTPLPWPAMSQQEKSKFK
ncbi:hypothetical protein, partial [Mycobacterium tuberculosis]